MYKILLIIGLPGSGKTHTANSMKDNNTIILDDITDITQIPTRLEDSQTLIIIDPYLCYASCRFAASNLLLDRFHIPPDMIFFENAPEKALANIKLRDDGRKVEGFIKQLSKEYFIPTNVVARSIYVPSSS